MEQIKTFYIKYLHTCIGLCVLLSFVLNLTIEALARQSFFNGLDFLMHSPLVFLYNMLIIFTTFAFVMLVKRRIFFYILCSGLWLTLGIVNGVILSNRMTPFTTKDLSVIEDGLSIVTTYLTTLQIILAIGGAVVLIAFLVILFIFAPKKKTIDRKKNIAIFLVICLGLFGSTNAAIKTNLVETFFGNLAYAYRDNGVPYCFITTWLNTGIKMPTNYSASNVRNIFDKDELDASGVATLPTKADEKRHPNIIMLQLESFSDPTLIKGVEVSQDPIPFYRSLEENYSTGFLTVPSVGAGTANTEFEIMTGMSVKFFGPGEYPYKSILMKEPVETVAYDLKALGYSAQAIHNHRGAFYGRNKVFPNMGFDTFTSLEYMNGAAKTPRNWAKDNVLTSQIMAALQATESEDYIYTISVQGHGKYPSVPVLTNPKITVETEPEDLKWQCEYYVNQLYEMDLFIKELVDRLSKFDEEVVLVMYGDHLPPLEVAEDRMENGSIYQTQYVIWSNFKMEREYKDLSAYQLSAYVLDRLNIHEGTIMKYHQNHKDSPTYLADLRMLQYDMLYGGRFIYGGKNIVEPTHLKMGVNPITIEEVVKIKDKLYIKGKNFTEFSKISLDGEILKTIYLGPTILGLEQSVDPDDVDRMKVSQVEKNKEILSTTE